MGFLRNKILKINSRRKDRTSICVLVEEPGKNQEYFDKTVDLSENGIFIETEEPRRRGEQVTLSFALPGTQPITVTGRVAHVVKGRGRLTPARQPNGMGIEFTQVDSRSRKLIQDFVNS